MWNAICQPVLIYGNESIDLNKGDSSLLNTTQSNCVKQALGFSKRVRSTHLLNALHIYKASDKVDTLRCSLLNRIMRVPCSAQSICSLFLSLYTSSGILIPGSLVERIVRLGRSPTRCAFGPPLAPNSSLSDLFPKQQQKYSVTLVMTDRHRVGDRSSPSGISDSLRAMIMHSNFIKPYSEEHILATLLIRAF